MLWRGPVKHLDLVQNMGVEVLDGSVEACLIKVIKERMSNQIAKAVAGSCGAAGPQARPQIQIGRVAIRAGE